MCNIFVFILKFRLVENGTKRKVFSVNVDHSESSIYVLKIFFKLNFRTHKCIKMANSFKQLEVSKLQ